MAHSRHGIERAITKVLFGRQFIEKVRSSNNPYRGGNSGQQIAERLGNIAFDKKFLTEKNYLLMIN